MTIRRWIPLSLTGLAGIAACASTQRVELVVPKFRWGSASSPIDAVTNGPDGSSVYFVSDVGDQPDIWRAKVQAQ